jgi:hypothetical protein
MASHCLDDSSVSLVVNASCGVPTLGKAIETKGEHICFYWCNKMKD